MYEILTDKQRSLEFPGMCTANGKLNYSDNMPYTANEVGYSIWETSRYYILDVCMSN